VGKMEKNTIGRGSKVNT